MPAPKPMPRLIAIAMTVTFALSGATLTAQEAPQAPASASAEPLITVIPGNLPIILTAPHGGTLDVPDTPARVGGEGVYRFVTGRDANTSELTEMIADALERDLGARPYVVMVRFHRRYADANREPKDAYEHENAKYHYDAFHSAVKSAVEEIVEKFGTGILFDVHGQSFDRDAIFRGTRDGEAVKNLMARAGQDAVTGPDSIFGQFKAMGYTTWPEVPEDGIGIEERYRGGFITDNYGSHRGTGIDAIQLEFGSNLRTKDRLEQTANDAAKAIATFAQKYLPLKVQEPVGAGR